MGRQSGAQKTDVRASPVLPHAVEKVVVVDNVG